MRVFVNFIFIAVLLFFVYAFVSMYIKEVKGKKIKSEIEFDGVETTGVIMSAHGRSGGNSGFINVDIEYSYIIESGKELTGKTVAVIDVMETEKYQPGKVIKLRYSRVSPEKVIVDIPNPLMKRRSK